jgi:TolB-like protein
MAHGGAGRESAAAHKQPNFDGGKDRVRVNTRRSFIMKLFTNETRMNSVRRTALFLFGVLFLACGGGPTPVSAPASVQAAAPQPDELDAAIRETSDYLNKQLPAGNKLVILNIQSDFPALSEYIIDELIANTVNDRVFSVVDRQQLNTIREELNFNMSGEVSDASAQSIGQMLGAQVIVSGAVSRIGDLYRLRVRALSVQTAEIEGQFNRNIPDGQTVAALVRSQATGYGGGAAALVPAKPGTVYNENRHSYQIVNLTMSWTDAKRYCEERGGYLASITDPGEQAFIENLLAREGSKSVYWLGGYCGNDRRFQWLTGERFAYSNWMPGQPDNSDNREDKIEITRIAAPYTVNSRPGHWNDAPANDNSMKGDRYDYYTSDLGFICEFDP